MSHYVALLRGVNVGGKNILPMLELRKLLIAVGCENVATYIQSGNVVLTHSESALLLAEEISNAIERQFGFRPVVMVLPSKQFSRIVAANPYVSSALDPKNLHVWFLEAAAEQANTARLEALQAEGETYRLTDSAFYLHAPNGVGRSKLASAAEKCLGVQATARNWRTVGRISALLEALP